MKNILSMFGCLGLLTSCSDLMFDRSYVNEMNRESDGMFVAGRDFPVSQGDTGNAFRSREEIKKRTPASRIRRDDQLNEDLLAKQLQNMQDNLSEGEAARFTEVSSYLPTKSEKIYYLKLSASERLQYLRTKGYTNQPELDTSFLQSNTPPGAEIELGMKKNEVVDRWGRPQRVDVAGNPRYENERWGFFYNGKMRYVYFESGVVQGWSLE